MSEAKSAHKAKPKTTTTKTAPAKKAAAKKAPATPKGSHRSAASDRMIPRAIANWVEQSEVPVWDRLVAEMGDPLADLEGVS